MSQKKFSTLDYSILLGNAIEHFDTAIYSFLAPVLANLFFPNHEPLIALALIYSILASSLITKPLGVMIFSEILKLKGPLLSLSYSLVGISFCSLAIALLPTYEKTGYISCILLIFFRTMMGIFASGESSIARIYILENKTKLFQFKSSYIYESSSMIGIIVASIVAFLVMYNKSENLWRVAFAFGSILGFVGAYIRNKTLITSIKTNTVASYKHYNLSNSLLDKTVSIWVHRVVVLKMSVVVGFSYMTYYLPFVLINALIPIISKKQVLIEDLMLHNSVLLVFDLISIFIIGKKIEQFHINTVMSFASLAIFILIFPIWSLIINANLLHIVIAKFIIIILGVIFTCPVNIWCKKQAPRENNYFIIGMANAVGSSVIGKLMPSTMLFLFHAFGNNIVIPVAIAIFSLITFCIVASPFKYIHTKQKQKR